MQKALRFSETKGTGYKPVPANSASPDPNRLFPQNRKWRENGNKKIQVRDIESTEEAISFGKLHFLRQSHPVLYIILKLSYNKIAQGKLSTEEQT